MHIRKGDIVKVITGEDKGKQGVVLAVNSSKNFAIVEGINIVVRHKKPRSAQDRGGIIHKPGNINCSNLMLVCQKCNKPTKIKFDFSNGEKRRICKHCAANLDEKLLDNKKVEKKVSKTINSSEDKKLKGTKEKVEKKEIKAAKKPKEEIKKPKTKAKLDKK